VAPAPPLRRGARRQRLRHGGRGRARGTVRERRRGRRARRSAPRLLARRGRLRAARARARVLVAQPDRARRDLGARLGHAVAHPPASTLLEELGIPVFQGYDSARLAGVDLVVCGNAVRRTNPEAEAAEAGGLRMLSMPAAVEEMFLAGRSPLVVAGTHGKTTS